MPDSDAKVQPTASIHGNCLTLRVTLGQRTEKFQREVFTLASLSLTRSAALVALLTTPALADTNGRITGSVGETQVDAAVTCNLGMWSEVTTQDTGDGTADTDGDGFALDLSGAPGTSIIFGMFAEGLGFQSGLMGRLDGNVLILDEPYHVLHTGERLPLDLRITCDG